MIRLVTIFATVLLLAMSASAADPSAYVINSLGETLSRVNLTTGQVDNDMLTLGTGVWTSPSQIVIRDTLAYVINSTSDELQIINLNSISTTGWIDFPTGSNPYSMSFRDDQYAYVTLLWNNSVAKVDVLSQSIVRTDSVGRSPSGIMVVDNRAYICISAVTDEYEYEQGELCVWDLDGDSAIATVRMPTNPNALDMDRLGRLHVICVGDYATEFGKVVVFDTANMTPLDTLDLGGSPNTLRISPDDIAYLAAGGWVSGGEMYAYDALTLDILHGQANPMTTTTGCFFAEPFEDSSVFVVGFNDTLQAMNSSGVVSANYEVGDGPVHVAFDYVPGDINGDWMVDIGDLTVLINHLFISFAPIEYPSWRAFVDGDQMCDIGDLTHMINFLFLDGERPKIGPQWLRW